MKLVDFIDTVNYYVDEILERDRVYRFKANAYRDLIKEIQSHFKMNEQITITRIRERAKVSERMMGHIQDIMKLKIDPSKQIISKIASISGIGATRARELFRLGVRTRRDLKKKGIYSELPLETQLFLKFKPLRQIPHDFITEIYKEFKKRFLNNPSVFNHYIVGSYRRKRPFSRDIDLMIVSSNMGIIADLTGVLAAQKDLFNFYIYSQGRDKVSGILEINTLYPGHKTPIPVAVKLDIFRTEPKEAPFMLLYSTGSKEFNIRMRKIARNDGYLLNQKGLYHLKNKKHVKTKFRIEKDIFKFLKMNYLEPHKRI